MRRNLATVIVSLALVAGTLAVFVQVRHHDFVNYDDDRYLVENPNVRNGLTGRGVLWAFTTRDAGFWIPLTFLSHMLDFQLFGPSPGGHHLTSLLIHSANTVLLFLVLVRLTGAFWQSAFVAALFAIHPLNVEPVAWVYERKGLLSTLFWVLSIWAYARYTERAGAGRYLVLLLLFSLGLMAKPMLVTLPFVLLLLDFWPLGRLHSGQAGAEAGSTAVHPEELRFRRTSAGRAILEKAPMLMIATLWGVLTMVGQRQIGALPSLDLFPVTVRIANSLVSYVTYLGKAFWPSHLATFYPHPGMPPWWKAITAAAVLAAISVVVIRLRRGRPYLAVGWFWFLGTLAPVIGMVQVGSHAMADRYAYLSLIGIFIMAA
ncbi:MAG: glycosyltransferase family 39 protein, partial [Proteobacteria bacterium]|nr:glycosyltransferase family 39 protein [Pseudomonadota bacterium]